MGQQALHIAVTGLDSHGKSTWLSKLVGGEDHYKKHCKIIDSNNILIYKMIENICLPDSGNEDRSYNFTLFDCNRLSHVSQSTTIEFWKVIMNNCMGVVFVLDSNDGERMNEAHEQFELIVEILKERNKKGSPCKLLILTSKMDLPNHVGIDEIVELFNLKQLKDHGLEWTIEAFDHMKNPYEQFSNLSVLKV